MQLNSTKSPQMLLRLPHTRVAFATGAVFFILCVILFQTQLPHVRTGMGASPSDFLNDIKNSTFGFEKIFVVGLPSRSDRRDGMLLQAALSNIEIEFIDGVLGRDVPNKAIPTSPDHERLKDPTIGSWRAHMNAIQEVVRRNLTSALILEDDVDWDVRIRKQLRDFALSTRVLTQPLVGSSGLYADSTYPNPSKDSPGTIADISFGRLPQTEQPKISPYGDGWDVLWVGHCGMHFPSAGNKAIPKGRVVHMNDETVAQKRHLWTFNIPFTLKEKYPQHTRVVHHTQEGVCSLGYAVSQKGARRLLNEVGLKDVSDAFDILLRFFCEGTKGRKYHNCLTVQPGLFHHHRPAGPLSASTDIGNYGDGFRAVSKTDMVRWSVRLNADVLLDGGSEFVDQYPDAD
ncbi:Procollagen galactosyltransferase 1 [Phialemonium atrogriseum]|uniref:Procollagen galactosyltransferase 1 n=1 Tax=Phialemonium atrogriseum TaxID=1093897 RepID=A0AAJ0FRI8_9PEZI|nr:Procollagen galactosyltransferase 1 [Phialemonium atrogriseum]KAK1772469.1 Procollagen galactosyltransferase 1 [Phialemonium atrogriseum]